MIVKIAFEGAWWIYDNVDRVRFSYGELEVSSEMEFVEHYLRFVAPPTGDGKPMKFVRLSWRDRSNNEIVVLFDEVAYLCNDGGKTIEKIPGPRIQ